MTNDNDKLRRLVDAYQIADTESPDAWEKAFCVRGDLLRPGFGNWDSCDPVAHAILDLVEAQNELADAISDYAEISASEAGIEAAKKNRRAAVERLARMLTRSE